MIMCRVEFVFVMWCCAVFCMVREWTKCGCLCCVQIFNGAFMQVIPKFHAYISILLNLNLFRLAGRTSDIHQGDPGYEARYKAHKRDVYLEDKERFLAGLPM